MNCGSIKPGSFNPCKNSGFDPESEIDMAYSLALTDHYFDDKVLNEINQAMKSSKPSPSLPPDQAFQVINAVRWFKYQ